MPLTSIDIVSGLITVTTAVLAAGTWYVILPAIAAWVRNRKGDQEK